jgi:ankyrin repeat protein
MKTRLVAYPAIVVSALLLIGLSSCEFPQSARLATMVFPQPAGDTLLSPDGRLLATVEATGKTTVLRVDGREPRPVLTVDFPVELATADHPDTPVQFSSHSAHLLLHNTTGFRVVDLATKQSVDFHLPSAPPPPDADAGSSYSTEEDTRLRPLTEDGDKPEPEEYFGNPPNESAPIAGATLSSTARYVVLRFDGNERVALLEKNASGYAFRRWIPVGDKSSVRFTFAGDDSMAAFVTSRGINTCALPSGRVHETQGGDCRQRELKDAVLSPHPTSAQFACTTAASAGDYVAPVYFYDGKTRTFSDEYFGRATILGASHLCTPDGPIVYPVVQLDQPLAQLEFRANAGASVESYVFEHDRALRSAAPKFYLGSGVSPEGSLLRLATRNAAKDTITIDTLDLAIVGAQTEARRESYTSRRQLGFVGGLALLCVVFEGSLFFSRRQERFRLQAAERLFAACASGASATVRKLTHGSPGRARVHLRNDHGFTPLLVAAGMGHAEIAEMLLAAGADITARDPKEQGTALTYACCSPAENADATALVLIKAGAEVRAQTKSGVTAAKLAAERGLVRTLAAIAEKDPEALALPNQEGVTPAYSAAESNQAACLALCVQHAPASLAVCRKEDHASPAYVAAFHGHEAALAVIARAAPATLRLPGPQGYLPATIAAQKGHTACVRLLTEFAPDTFAVTVEGEKRITPAFLAAQNGHHETLELIAGAAPATLGQPRATDAVTPAYQAAFKGHHRCLEILGRHAPNSLLTRNAEQHLPAFVAAQNGHVPCLEVLQKYAPATLADSTEGTPAFIASQLNQVAALRFLLKAVPGSFDALFSGNNPAHIAAGQGHEEAYALIAAERPALLTVENPAGKTPPQLLEVARAERKEKTEQAARAAAKASAGIVLWGIGFEADTEMLRSAILTVARGNMLKGLLLFGLPAECSKLESNPSEIEAAVFYTVVARIKGWKADTPKFQFLGLPDGRKLLLAYPPIV